MLDRHILGPSVFDDDDNGDDSGDDNNVCEATLRNNMPDYADLRRNGELEWYDLDSAGREYYCSPGSASLYVTEQRKDTNGKVVDNVEVVEIRDLEKYDAELADGNDSGEGILVRDYEREREPERLETGKQYLQIYSAEKGTFLSAVVAIQDNDEFDVKKLKLRVADSLDEEDEMIEAILYDGEELETDGAETRGKGIDVYLIDY